MNKLLFSARKEVLLIIRDIPGMMILFLMPVILMIVVILAQEYALRNQPGKTNLLLINESHSGFSYHLLKTINLSGFFEADTLYRGQPVTWEKARELLKDGRLHFGLYIPCGDTSMMIITDPAMTEPYRTNMVSSLKYLIRATQSMDLVKKFLSVTAGDLQPDLDRMMEKSMETLPPVREEYAEYDKAEIKPTPMQNIVPGFILFSMFFIVIPLASSIILEKNEGAFQRLKTLPVGFAVILGSKVMVYFIVCLVQFMLMMAIGVWVFPYFLGLPAFHTGSNIAAILLATVAASSAAIGFGILIGSASGTIGQASLFGSVMVVLLGVISGTFLPVHVMPYYLRLISLFSPLRWGIENYLDVFIRSGNVQDILPGSILLFLFFILAMIISIFIFAKRKL